MIAAESYLADWTAEQYRMVEKTILIAQHRLHQSGLFSDEALIDLIDRHPEEYVTIAAMGNDANKFEWMNGERGDVSAADILRLVREKQLWVNLIRLNRFQPEYARLVDSLYNDLERHCPGFKALHRSANLLISSPNAMVYYHIDLPVNMLWHLRGEKQVWVYPPFDDRFASPRNIERIIVGEMAEDMPYQPWFEDYALTFKLKPGQMITWPQNTPHRVTNLDGLNVSLSTEHRNRMAKRRINVHLANHYLRQQFGWEGLSTDPRGWTGPLKEVYARACRVTQQLMAKKKLEPFSYGKRFRLDMNAERGLVMLDAKANPETEAVLQELAGAGA
ncbi:cupin-like domain-containing protein [Rubinisphaera sp. JC750]|uniref:cupin-like domain-containing protein n=1 Tax=Rubinisphaera sp. JC750 TaxID=2898658 RepID=UPI001F2317EF|nr:cupin-like domain-containing protein [Rubinisphaera sp. JC750]